jgi:hypothetical protein
VLSEEEDKKKSINLPASINYVYVLYFLPYFESRVWWPMASGA